MRDWTRLSPTLARMRENQMDGERVRGHLSREVKALLATYRQFEELVPAQERDGAAHPGEDGRYVESLVRACLGKFLPSDLDVRSGFILRPAVKTGVNGRERKDEQDEHSTQLDVIVFDSARYPVFQRFADAVIVPPESVVGIVSVKKTLCTDDIEKECKSLQKAAKLCRCLDAKEQPRRGPYLAIIGMDYQKGYSPKNMPKTVFKKVSSAYPISPAPLFDEVIGFIGVINNCGSVFKKRPEFNSTPEEAKFVGHTYGENEEHLALQFLITGIASVYYDPTRNTLRRPGFTGFESGREHDYVLGAVKVSGLR